MMIVTIPLLSHRDNNRTVIYKTMPKMIITEMRYQRDRPHSATGRAKYLKLAGRA